MNPPDLASMIAAQLNIAPGIGGVYIELHQAYASPAQEAQLIDAAHNIAESVEAEQIRRGWLAGDVHVVLCVHRN